MSLLRIHSLNCGPRLNTGGEGSEGPKYGTSDLLIVIVIHVNIIII